MATYYIRKDGLDSHNGLTDSADGAWLTIQKAANTMVAGDTVYIKAGTYTEKVTPAIDAGTPSYTPATDYIGTQRPQGAGVDIGAYEYIVQGILPTSRALSHNLLPSTG